MLARYETIFKWVLYAAAALLCFVVQWAVVQRFTIWGVIPFLYPLTAVIPASYEGPIPGTIFALCMGILCDLLLPEALPCLFTLTFPLVGLNSALLGKSLLPTGFVCSLVGSAIAFLLIDGFRCLLMWFGGESVWDVGMWLMLREFCVTAPLTIPATLLFQAVHRKVHAND